MDLDPLFDAAARGDVEAVRAGIASSPTPVRARAGHGKTLLHVAAEHDHAELASWLVEAGADLEAEADWGQTPFEWAANLGKERVASRLLDAGSGRLSLWTAAALGLADEVRQRLAAGHGAPAPRVVRNVERYEWPEDTALWRGDAISDAFYIACRNGRRDVAEILLEAGADVDARGYFGATALHWAAMNGHRETVEWLVASGADVRIRDPRFDASPAGWAHEGGHVELVQWLREVGG